MYFLHSLTILSLVAINYSSKIDFFQEKHYKGLIASVSGPGEPKQCANFLGIASKQISSVKCHDSCVILYDSLNCAGQSIKIMENVDNLGGLKGNGTNDNFDKRATSYRFCGEKEGTDNVKVDFFDDVNYKNEVATYSNICNCISLPSSMLVDVSSIDNHHNCIELYTKDNCEDDRNAVTLYAGRSTLSANLKNSAIYKNLKSFIPCKIPSNCTKLNALLYHFEIYEGPSSEIATKSSSNSMSMSAKTVVWNNGTATVKQEYSATRAVREVIELESIQTKKTVETWSTTKTTTKSIEVKYSIVLKAKVTKTVEEKYSKTEENGYTEREKFTSETLTEFTATQTIEVPPCSFYEVESFVTMIEDFPLYYKAFFKFTGEIDGVPMTVSELRRAVEAEGEFFFHEKVDDFTISAYAPSNISASFGVETKVDGVGARIPYCYA